MKKTVWIINQYASTPETGYAGRHYYFAKELAKRGYNVYLIAASFTHLLREPPLIIDNYNIENVAGFKFVWVSVPIYQDAHDKKRVLNWLKFAWKILNLPQVITDIPDTILFSSPSLLPYFSAYRLAKKLKSKLVWDIRDIWPLTLTEIGGMSKKHPFVILHQLVEDYACKRSDFITSNWPYANKHLALRGATNGRFLWVPNGFYADEFVNSQPLDAEIYNQLPCNKFIIGYTGTFGKANAIQYFIETASVTKEYQDIHYVLVGSGKLEPDIISFIESNGLRNVTLIKSIPKAQIPAILSCFDVCYVGFNKSNLYRYGSSLNKLPEYLMSGKPIIYSIDSPFKPVDDAMAGITVPAEDPIAIAEAIYKLKAMSKEQRSKFGENGRKYALNNYDYNKLTEKLIEVLF